MQARFLLLPAAVSALLLAGCASSPPPAEAPQPEPLTTSPPEPLVLAEGTYEWHRQQPGLYAPLTYYAVASQAAVSPCVWNGEPYFNNRQLSLGIAGLGHTAATGNLTFTADWEPTDWTGTALWAAYKAPGQDDYREVGPIPKGGQHVAPVTLDTGSENTDWDLWLCINSSRTSLAIDAGHQPGPFLGSVRISATFAPGA